MEDEDNDLNISKISRFTNSDNGLVDMSNASKAVKEKERDCACIIF